MKPSEERIEVELAIDGNDELAVEDEPRLGHRFELRDDLGEVATQRSVVPTAEIHRVFVTERDAAEAVPLGLVEAPGGQRALQAGEHRRDGRLHHPFVANGT